MLRSIHLAAGCIALFAATAGVAQEAEPARVQADVKAILEALVLEKDASQWHYVEGSRIDRQPPRAPDGGLA